jgi:hypothetical protein
MPSNMARFGGLIFPHQNFDTFLHRLGRVLPEKKSESCRSVDFMAYVR